MGARPRERPAPARRPPSRTAACVTSARSSVPSTAPGASSTTFWCRRWSVHSRSNRCTARPWPSPRTCTSMWRGSTSHFSTYTLASPNPAAAIRCPPPTPARSSALATARALPRDVAGLDEHLFHVHARLAERGGRDPLRPLDRRAQLGLVARRLHALAAATQRRLEHDRVAHDVRGAHERPRVGALGAGNDPDA